MVIDKIAKHKKLVVDTAPFIYYMENNNKYGAILDKLFELSENGIINIFTSSITLLEILVKPYELKNYELIKSYETIFENAYGIELISVNKELSRLAAKLRAQYKIKTPDAIQLALCNYTNTKYFLTNDKRLKSVKEIDILIIDELI